MESCTFDQLNRIAEFVHRYEIDHSYFGVPSVSSEIPFQIIKHLEDVPGLIAYEFLFKPESHHLWRYVSELKSKPNVHWALPLPNAKIDFDVEEKKLHVIGHISIDNANMPKSGLRSREEIKKSLQVTEEQSLAFISTTTQPISVDKQFLDHILAELPNHPRMQVRLGLHPGIQDFDNYMKEIVSIYQAHPNRNQFKIILPESLVSRFKCPEITITNPLYQSLFLRTDISGPEAAFAADKVAQAVPGALLNQAALEGKPAYSHSGKPYLPHRCFSDNVGTFFSSPRQSALTKEDLGLNKKTAPERCAELF